MLPGAEVGCPQGRAKAARFRDVSHSTSPKTSSNSRSFSKKSYSTSDAAAQCSISPTPGERASEPRLFPSSRDCCPSVASVAVVTAPRINSPSLSLYRAIINFCGASKGTAATATAPSARSAFLPPPPPPLLIAAPKTQFCSRIRHYKTETPEAHSFLPLPR